MGAAGTFEGRLQVQRRFHLAMTVVGAVLLVGLIAKLGPVEILESLSRLEAVPLALGTALAAAEILLSAQRWVMLARTSSPGASPSSVRRAFFAASFLANLSPARSGEVAAPVLLRESAGMPLATGAALVIVDRAADLVALLLCTALAALRLRSLPASSGLARLTGAVLVVLVVLVVAVGAFLFLSPRATSTAASAAERRAGWRGLAARAFEGVGRIRAAGKLILTPPALRRLAVATVVCWVVNFARMYVLAAALAPISFFDNLVCQTISGGAALASFVPGGLGVKTLGYVMVGGLMGYDATAMAAASVAGLVLTHGIRLALTVATRLSAATSGAS